MRKVATTMFTVSRQAERGAYLHYTKWADLVAAAQNVTFYKGDFDEPYADITFYNGVWYMCTSTYTVKPTNGNNPSATTNRWALSANAKFVATEIFFANKALVNNLQVSELVAVNGLGEVTASITADNGTLKCENIVANSGTIGCLTVTPTRLGMTVVGDGSDIGTAKTDITIGRVAVSGQYAEAVMSGIGGPAIYVNMGSGATQEAVFIANHGTGPAIKVYAGNTELCGLSLGIKAYGSSYDCSNGFDFSVFIGTSSSADQDFILPTPSSTYKGKVVIVKATGGKGITVYSGSKTAQSNFIEGGSGNLANSKGVSDHSYFFVCVPKGTTYKWCCFCCD